MKKLKLFLIAIFNFARKVWLKFKRDEGFLKAQALSYSSLLSFIPLAFVALSIIPSKLFLASLQEKIKSLILRIFLPHAAMKISAYVDEFLRNAQSLGIFGLASFIVTSLMFLETVDRTFGDIWGIRKRSFLIRLTLFWAFITVPPILMGISIYLNYVIKSRITFRFIELLYIPMPYVIAVLAFTLIYAVFPSADVKFRYALGGGIFTGFLWLIVKQLFSLYVRRAITYRTIYGSLWLIPVFIFWLYIVWTIVLLGAEFTYVLQWPSGRGKRTLYRVLLLFRGLYLNLLSGEKALQKEQAMRLCGIEREEFEALLQDMEKRGWILECEDGISLSRLPDRIKVVEVMEIAGAFETGWDKKMNNMVLEVKKAMQQKMNDLTLGELFERVCGIRCRHDIDLPHTEQSEALEQTS